MGLYAAPRLLPAGDGAVTVELGDEISRDANARALTLERLLLEARMPGLLDTVPTFRSLLVQYDPLVLPWMALRARLLEELLLPVALGQELGLALGVDLHLERAGVLRLVEQFVDGLRRRTPRQQGDRRQDQAANESARRHDRLSAGGATGAGTGTVSRSGAIALSATANPCRTAERYESSRTQAFWWASQ